MKNMTLAEMRESRITFNDPARQRAAIEKLCIDHEGMFDEILAGAQRVFVYKVGGAQYIITETATGFTYMWSHPSNSTAPSLARAEHLLHQELT